VSESGPNARVLIADAQTSTRAGIRMAVDGHGFTVCADVASADDAVATAIRERPDLCLIDVSLPGSGIAAAEEISTQAPDTAIVMLSGSASDDELFACVRAGARGYLSKDMDPARLPFALRGVLRGEAALSRPLVARVLEELRERERGRHASELTRLGVELTHRERQVLDLLERGLRTSEMAERLKISAVTVRRHVSEILRKLEAPDREAALKLLRAVRERP
jgi:two-component system, NarL family, nitrate/nitrite response regulator NarL